MFSANRAGPTVTESKTEVVCLIMQFKNRENINYQLMICIFWFYESNRNQFNRQ